MTREQKGVKAEGMVFEALPGLLFRVRLDDGKEVLAHLAGKMKINYIRVIPGDRVIVEMPSAEDRRGRIVRRF
ncbi:MAG: Translation initiation factor IF-1 [Candidatus Jorgensenbacteria bacterium GW2011_GWA1_48_13]|uniref:Translation initiation factor IF-1 n=2 Tax=Candidatus Joergenseniibacteriota TaxID=1752739 RepID=A0A0G1WA31_9BACT|nr:MAG: Translation initiation factor IF-1 [Candidatus Jorgensenbacteria bacterium GW2011_GWA1_48_13]KKU99110.1 MAG: Translation initiation factor IF-1 [Candidatus Jorgensenbacteria bacterium GW2011_GWC1_48_8]KKW15480.1 MAG: Translation initiation factor IF-1 [Candidatus Jorgensenbacteria bacterium GW2011_GWB1_50_10]